MSSRSVPRMLWRFFRFKRRHWRAAIQQVVIPTSTSGTLGQIFSALSIYAILHNSIKFGLSSTMALIVSVYMRGVDLTIGMLDPAVRWIISDIQRYLTVVIVFHSGWRYLFIVLQMLFVRDAMTAYLDGRRALGIFRLIIGFVISTSCSILAFPHLDKIGFFAPFLFCAVPVIGLLIYDIIMYGLSATLFFHQIGAGEGYDGQSRGSFFSIGLARSGIRLLVVLVPSTIALLIPGILALPFPGNGVVALFIGMLANTTYWLVYGARYALVEVSNGKKFRKAFAASEAGRFGLAVAGVFFWFAIFCLTNAGGRLVGL